MPIMFNHKTEEELDAELDARNKFTLLPAGKYYAVICDAEEKVSANSGNNMIELKLKVINKSTGEERIIKDFLTFVSSMIHKIYHCCNSCSILDKYTSNILSGRDFLNKICLVDIIIEKGKLKNKDRPEEGFHFDQNVIKNYIKRLEWETAITENDKLEDIIQVKKASDDLNDDIPF